MITRANLPKVSGYLIITAVIFSLVGNLLHPQSHYIDNENLAVGTVGFVELMASQSLPWLWAHSLSIFFAPLLLAGYVLLWINLYLRKGVSLFSYLALGFHIFWTFLATLAVILDAYVSPILANIYTSSPDSQPYLLAIINYSHLVDLNFFRIAFLCIGISVFLTCLALLKTDLYPKWLSFMGLGVGSFGVVGYMVGLFGLYWFHRPIFQPFAFFFLAWFFLLGYFTTKLSAKN